MTDGQLHIPRRTRGAILNWFSASNVSWEEIYRRFQLQAGFGDENDIRDDIRRVEGETALEELQSAVEAEIREVANRDASYGRLHLSEKRARQDAIAKREGGRYALLHMPDRLFATAVEAAYSAFAWIHGQHGIETPPIGELYLNRLLEEQGVPYRFDDDENRCIWTGDRAVHDEVVGPALVALGDPRLSTPTSDFERALAGRNASRVAQRKTAVNEATKALEGVMTAVLESHGHSAPAKRQVAQLWERLVDEKLAPRDMQDIVVGGSKVSNKRGRHTNPVDVTTDEAEAVVMSVAVAINYLATRMAPGP